MARPEQSYKCAGSGVEVAYWVNDKGGYYSVSKTYKDKDQKWQKTEFYNRTDLLVMRDAIDRALSYQAPAKEPHYLQANGSLPEMKDPFANDSDIPF